MKKLLVTTMALALVLVAFKSNAQLSYGLKAGLNIANISQDYKEADWEQETKMLFSYKAGLAVDYALSDALSIKSGLEWNVKGYAADLEEMASDMDGAEVEGSSKATVNYLELPINVAYKMAGIQFYAGPYISYAIGGKMKDDYTVKMDGEVFMESDEEIDFVGVSDGYGEGDVGDDEMPVNMLDYGLNVGAGYTVGPVLVTAQYGLGLGNLSVMPEGSETDASDYKTTNNVITVSASFFF